MTGSQSSPMLNILFVCVGNSCRSQMAEAFVNCLANAKVRAWSAGSRPLGIILPETLAVMREKGISLDGQRSKGLQDVPVNEMDAFVTMGCEVECPAPAGFKGLKIEWNIPDPYGQSHHQFRNVRDLIEQQVRALLSDLEQNQLVRRENRASA